jgi:hypothetical protein
LDEFAELPENRGKGWLEIMKDFADQGSWSYSMQNTYNWENLLSQVLQYVQIDADDETYLILQIHNGCDVRGGYTAPRIFKVTDIDYFYLGMTGLDAVCGCGRIYSDDCGYHWHDDTLGWEGDHLPPFWSPQPAEEDARPWEYKLICERCGEEVGFYANLEY